MGPLSGIRVVELAAIGPVPFCAMLLADLGADVVRVDRPGPHEASSLPDGVGVGTGRGRRSIAIDLKNPHGKEVLFRLVEASDVLIEGYRPGVVERLGVGPEQCKERNPKLVYGRMTGWGQSGPLASMAGHDINYIGLTGALHAIGEAGDKPVPPLNLAADYGGGALYLATGILAALVERERSGEGQVIDAAMVDGSASLMTIFYQLHSSELWSDERGMNLLDGGAPFYRTYGTADGKYVAVGALEPKFYGALLEGLDLEPSDLPEQFDRDGWPVLTDRFSAIFATKTRDEWEARFFGTDACVTPVLSLAEAPTHPHLDERRSFIISGGAVVPAPAPRFSRSRPVPGRASTRTGAHTWEVLEDIGLNADEIEVLTEVGAVA